MTISNPSGCTPTANDSILPLLASKDSLLLRYSITSLVTTMLEDPLVTGYEII